MDLFNSFAANPSCLGNPTTGTFTYYSITSVTFSDVSEDPNAGEQEAAVFQKEMFYFKKWVRLATKTKNRQQRE